MMKLDEYLTEMLMPIYPAELENHRQDFFLLYINVMPFGGEGIKLTVADLEKDISKKLPATAKNYIFVYDELNDNTKKLIKQWTNRLLREYSLNHLCLLNGNYDRLRCTLI